MTNKTLAWILVGFVAASAILGAKTWIEDRKAPSEAVTVIERKPIVEPFDPAEPIPYPNRSASQEELKKWLETMMAHAVATTTIDVSDCAPVPKVAEVERASPFTLKNTGTTSQIIRFGEKVFEIAPASSTEITLEFRDGTGVYGYQCGVRKLMGAIVVQ